MLTCFGAPAVAGFNYKNKDRPWADDVLAFTEGVCVSFLLVCLLEMVDNRQLVFQGKGVNVILDCIGASYFESNLKCIGLDGRCVRVCVCVCALELFRVAIERFCVPFSKVGSLWSDGRCCR